jgi:hypothetical protein
MLKVIIAIILSCLALTASASNLAQVKITSPFAKLIQAQLTKKNIDIDEHSNEDNFSLTFYTTNSKQSLSKLITYPHQIESFIPGTPLKNLRNKSHKAGLKDYFDADEALNEMRKLEAMYPKYVTVHNINEMLELPLTADGNALYALQVSRVAGELHNTAKILLIGQHHAREVMTHHAVLDSAKDLLKKIGSNQRDALAQLNKTSYWFVPVVNPDGLNFVFNSNNWWRKNRRNNLDGSFGVDLNRNYSYAWGACGNNSSSGSSDVFKGPSAASEVEVQAMSRLNAFLKADMVISYHSSGDEVLYPYVCHKNTKITDQDVYYSLRDRLADHLNFGKRYASSSGEDFEHHFNKNGSLSFLLEIGSSFQPSFSTYEREVKPSILKVLPFLSNELNTGYLTVNVIDTVKKSAIQQVNVEIKELPLLQNERRQTNFWGTYRRKVIAKDITLIISKEGYQTKTIKVQLQQRQNKVVNIDLSQTKK